MTTVDDTAVDVTVALLTHNAGALLERVIEAVLAQSTQRRVELLAVDSASTDGTTDLLRRHGARIVPAPPGGFDFGRTRDLAFEEARGEVVVSLSQDAVPAHPDWIENLLRPLSDPKVAASCGRSVPDPSRDYPQFPWERNGHFYFTREMRQFRRRYGRGLSNANSAIRRTVWERLRFGPQTTGEDFRFQTKIHAEGAPIAFPDGAEVLHHHDYTFRSLLARCRNEGVGLRELGCPYGAADLFLDLFNVRVGFVWLRELCRGRLTTPAALAFPSARPLAVYYGSRFGRGYAP